MKDFKKLHAIDYLKILWKRRWYVLITVTVVVAGTGIVSWRLPKVYRSETRILVESTLIPDYVRTGGSSPRNGSLRSSSRSAAAPCCRD